MTGTRDGRGTGGTRDGRGTGTRDERGVGLVELMVALAIFAMVIVAVDVSLTIVTARSDGMAQSTTAIDQLQTAEQTVVQDVHAANSWCDPVPTPAYGCASFTQIPTATSLDFSAEVDGATNTYDFVINTTSHQLTLSENGANAEILLTNLDPSPTLTGFTVNSTTRSGTTYYTSVGISLTVDSPTVGAPRITRTTAADSQVEAWNVEYACSVPLEAAGGGSC